jgi:hypothetical protein
MGRKRHLKGDKPPPDPFTERRTKALRALKEYQRSGSFKENYAEVIDVLMDESDRGAVMLVGGILEDVLTEQIIEKLPQGRACKDNLLRQGGTLSSVQDKLSIGMALGILDEATNDSLDIIRQLRNACAHTMRRADFATPAVSGAFGLLLPEDLAAHIAQPGRDKNYLRFVLSMVMIFHVERIRGKSQADAQAVVDRLTSRFQARVDAAVEKHRASLEKRRARRKKAGPQSQKGGAP